MPCGSPPSPLNFLTGGKFILTRVVCVVFGAIGDILWKDFRLAGAVGTDELLLGCEFSSLIVRFPSDWGKDSTRRRYCADSDKTCRNRSRSAGCSRYTLIGRTGFIALGNPFQSTTVVALTLTSRLASGKAELLPGPTR